MSSGAPLETSTVIRYPATALLSVSTDDGFQYTKDTHELIEGPNPANLQINNGRTIMAGYLTRLALTETMIEWNIPNVNNNNHTLTIRLNDLSGNLLTYARVVLDVGFYSPAKLIRDLEKEINDNADLKAVFDAFPDVPVKQYFDVYLADEMGEPAISSYGGSTLAGKTVRTKIPRVGIRLQPNARLHTRFNLISSTADPAITGKRREQNDLLDMLGWTTSDGGVKNYIKYVGGYASFQYTPYIDLVSQQLTRNQKVSDSDSSKNSLPNKLARIYLCNEIIEDFYAEATYQSGPVGSGGGDLIAWDDSVIGTNAFVFRREFKYPKQIQWNTQQNIDFIELQILDYKGQFLPINYKTSDSLAYGPDGQPIEPFQYTHEVPNFAEFRFTMMASEN
jgi:hypothetical protein